MKSFILIILIVCTCFGCKSPEARRPVNIKSGSFINESAKRNKALNAKERTQIETIIFEYTDKKFLTSENGFWYAYNTKIEKDTPMPQFGDRIEYTYDISDLNGNTIYSKSEIGKQTYHIDKEELFSGLREGLKLMKPTEDITFIFPSQKAYGYYGDDNRIGTNIPLICNVILNTIIKNND